MMKRSLLYIIILQFSFSNVLAQNLFKEFVIDPSAQEGISNASWFDYNYDGLIDVFFGNQRGLFFNQGNGNFTKSDITINAEFTFGQKVDYDKDGDLDLLYGSLPNGEGATIFINNGDGSWNKILTEFDYDQAQWDDFDQDGDYDLLFSTGYNSGYPEALVHKLGIAFNQNDGSFKKVITNISFRSDEVLGLIDYDLNGFKDIYIREYRDYTYRYSFYKNSGDLIFTEDVVPFPEDALADILYWQDYNNDTYPDFITHINESEKRSVRLYKNNSGESFEQVSFKFENVNYGPVEWADYDHDGLVDFVLLGTRKWTSDQYQDTAVNVLYKNLGNDLFEKQTDTIWAAVRSRGEWIDINNDGHQDLSVGGYTPCGSAQFTCINNHLNFNINTAKGFESATRRIPQVPANLKFEAGHNNKLSWTTSDPDVTFNVYLKNITIGEYIMRPLVDLDHGNLYMNQAGNVGTRNFLFVENMPAGTYVWSVQSINGEFSPSEFASEATFTLLAPVDNFSITGLSYQGVGLSWNSYTNAENFIIERANEGANFVAIDTIPGSATNYIDQSVIASNVYRYRIRVLTNGNVSVVGNILEADLNPLKFMEIEELNFDALVDFAWVDFDNDGDFDLAGVNFFDGNSALLLFEKNSDGKFIKMPLSFPVYLYPNLKIIDYNKDNYADIWLEDSESNRIFINNKDKTFTALDSSFYTSVGRFTRLLDYDRDGHMELFFQKDGNLSFYKINEKGISLTENIISTSLPAIYFDFVDLDNDSYMDLFISEKGIYKNANGEFVLSQEAIISINPFFQDVHEWHHINNDGYIDLVTRNHLGRIEYFVNDQSGHLVRAYSPVIDNHSWSNLIDFDYDGDLDYFFFDSQLEFYFQENTGNDFIKKSIIKSPYQPSSRLKFALIDLDRDNDLDLLHFGSSYDRLSSIPSLLKNRAAEFGEAVNTLPDPPQNLSIKIVNDGVKLQWDQAKDNETPDQSLQYNFYLKRNGEFVFTPLADLQTGLAYIPYQGNLTTNSVALTQLAPGNYEWGVQTIDGSLGRSVFTTGEVFTIESSVPEFSTRRVSSNHVEVNWSKVPWASSYVLLRSLQPEYGFKEIANLPVDDNHMLDEDLVPNQDYYYKIIAIGENIISAPITSEVAVYDFELQLTTSIKGYLEASMDFCDFDSDGDFDLAIGGKTMDGGIETAIYTNDGKGNFELAAIPLEGLYAGDIQWTDLNNDNHPDLLVSGKNAAGFQEFNVYVNQGNNSFSLINIRNDAYNTFDGNAFSAADFDNDARIELINRYYLYEYIGEEYYATDTIFYGEQVQHFVLDYDQDGDLDVLQGGSVINSTRRSPIKLNINNGERNFEEQPFSHTYLGDYAAIADINLDKKWDFLSMDHNNNYEPMVIYGNMQDWDVLNKYYFTNMEYGWGNFLAADFDLDGYIDFTSFNNETLNSHYDIFYFKGINDFKNQKFDFKRYWEITSKFSDLDGDKDLDMIVLGKIQEEVFTNVYFNNKDIDNAKPEAPRGLQTIFDYNSVDMSWQPSTDAETPDSVLTYNLYLRDKKGNVYLAPLADLNSGKRKVMRYGNVGYNLSWKLTNLPAGEYFWSVQAIDNSYQASEFAPEQSVLITGLEGNEFKFSIHPNPGPGFVRLNLGQPVNLKRINLVNINGGTVFSKEINQYISMYDLDFSRINAGVYIVEVLAEGFMTREKIVLY